MQECDIDGELVSKNSKVNAENFKGEVQATLMNDQFKKDLDDFLLDDPAEEPPDDPAGADLQIEDVQEFLKVKSRRSAGNLTPSAQSNLEQQHPPMLKHAKGAQASKNGKDDIDGLLDERKDFTSAISESVDLSILSNQRKEEKKKKNKKDKKKDRDSTRSKRSKQKSKASRRSRPANLELQREPSAGASGCSSAALRHDKSLESLSSQQFEDYLENSSNNRSKKSNAKRKEAEEKKAEEEEAGDEVAKLVDKKKEVTWSSSSEDDNIVRSQTPAIQILTSETIKPKKDKKKQSKKEAKKEARRKKRRATVDYSIYAEF